MRETPLIRLPWWNVFRHNGDATGSLLFAIGHALEKVREGPKNDESLALTANRLVRRHLDKGAITYKEYRLWRYLNPLVFTTIVDDENQLIGFFDIFPLKADAGEAIIAGTLTERSLRPEHIIRYADAAGATHLHIATILVNPRQHAFRATVAKEVLLLKMMEFVERHYVPIESRTFTAFAQSREGKALLTRSGFSMVVPADENEQRFPLYVLRPSASETAIFRFGRAEDFFSRKSILKRLDSRIEKIELLLRALISVVSSGDAGQLPPHVNQKIDERLNSAAKKSAAFDVTQYKRLPARLEFCDLRELQDSMMSKVLWPSFQARFGNKETLGTKFDQLAELRNGIRHTRSVDQITQKEGEAGLIWFERILSN